MNYELATHNATSKILTFDFFFASLLGGVFSPQVVLTPSLYGYSVVKLVD